MIINSPSPSTSQLISNSHQPLTSQTSPHDSIPPQINEAQDTKRPRQRINRACDACRKMKTKCILPHTAPCESCKHANRLCTFNDTGVKRDKPPTKRDVEQLNSKIKSLEKILKVLAPQLDLSSLPRTADQARTMANSNRINEPETNAHTLLKERMIKPDVGDPCYLHEVLTSMAQLHLSSLDYLDNEDSLKANSATFPTRWERSDQSGEPDLAYLMTNDHRSIVERSMERQHFRHALGSHCYPPPDLAESLLHLYFQKVHPYEYILHQGEFMQDYKRGLAEHDASFRSLCYAIFAAASRFSTDLRVMPAMDGPQVNRQAAGALYVVAAGTLLTPMSLPCTLFDLQAMAVLSYVLISTSSPTTAWFMVGMSLRRAQDVGAHLTGTPRWETSIMKDQLRKRAFWYLHIREIQLCVSLGRVSCMRQTSATVDHPIIVDDAILTLFCEKHVGKSPLEADIPTSDSPTLFLTSPILITNHALHALQRKFGVQLRKLWSLKVVPDSRAWHWDRHLVRQIGKDMEDHIQHHIPPEARWNPDAVDEAELIYTSRLECVVSHLQICIHRHLINTNPNEIRKCLAASGIMLDVLDHLKSRGLLEATAAVTPYLITSAALTFVYAACTEGNGLTATDRADAWADSHRCVNILAALAPTTFQAEKLQTSLDHLVKACIKEQLFPHTMPTDRTSKRSASEMITASLRPSLTPSPPGHSPQNGLESSRVISSPATQDSPPMLQLFNLPAPKLDACMFQYPGTGLDPPPVTVERPFELDLFASSSATGFPTMESGLSNNHHFSLLPDEFQQPLPPGEGVGPSTSSWLDHGSIWDGLVINYSM